MKNLINFFVKNSFIFLFLLLELFALFLISNNKGYQRSVLLSSTNSMTGWIYEQNSYIWEYVNLRTTNQSLVEENLSLKNRLAKLESLVIDSTLKANSQSISPNKEYRYISAKVIKNTTHFTQNYITLNKGSNDGIRPDMGVIANNSVVGIVETVSPKFSRVISLLHPIISISSKFKHNSYFGSLTWNGEDYRYAKLKDIARHVKVNKADTLITSGLVKTFPEGILVGTIDKINLEESDSYYDIDVKLSTDFRSLVYVQVVDYLNYKEQEELENPNTDSDK